MSMEVQREYSLANDYDNDDDDVGYNYDYDYDITDAGGVSVVVRPDAGGGVVFLLPLLGYC